ncbi:MAG: hypothetical protein ACRDJ4_02305 [Actinomycetota bacterium]
MPEIPLNAPQAVYLLSMMKLHLREHAPDESELTAEIPEQGRGVVLRRGNVSWSAERDGLVEVTELEDGTSETRRWRFGKATIKRY